MTSNIGDGVEEGWWQSFASWITQDGQVAKDTYDTRTRRTAGNGEEREGKPAAGMQVSEWHNRSAKVGGIRRDCLREQGDPGARQLPRVSTSLARFSSLLSSSLSLSLSHSFSNVDVCVLLLPRFHRLVPSFFLSFSIIVRSVSSVSVVRSSIPSSSLLQETHSRWFASTSHWWISHTHERTHASSTCTRTPRLTDSS